MRTRKVPFTAVVPLLLLVAGVWYYVGRDSLPSLRIPKMPTSSIIRPPFHQPVRDGAILRAGQITEYLDAIFDIAAPTSLTRFVCPAFDTARYEPLKTRVYSSNPKIRYFFALDLRNCVSLLPRLIGSIVEAMEFLGPESCALSIIEGDSPDGTADVLAALRSRLEALGVTYFFESSTINSSDGDRISKLAELRNMALQPLINNRGTMTKDTTVLFINDVAACPDDILELAFQRQALQADMTCAMDWIGGPGALFYDVWVTRGINGDSFFPIGSDGSWDRAPELFWNDPETKARFDARRPFQVFSCWNGAVSFTAQPILEGLRFRTWAEPECKQGEPQLFCKDLWFRGFGRIAVVPSINFDYSVDAGLRIKMDKGFTADTVAKQDLAGDRINWSGPPDAVKCMPSWDGQFWQPWNESLV